ncbi:MAG TPA: NAD-dependent epimerase/dehydratase family protein, partial [Symbiobacteriaceae bacterium]|nr:NAD-dependent epimerase/dehydratase family protein [Symbiobacteriaceae bacterium]
RKGRSFMQILVIGGTRFMGPHVVRRLLDQGHQVTLFHRGNAPLDLPGIQVIKGDRRRLSESATALSALQPDVILDMVPMIESDAVDLINLFRGQAGRLVAIGSADVYRNFGGLIGRVEAEPDPTPMNEDSPLRARLYPYRGETPLPADHPMAWRDAYDKIPVEQAVLGAPELSGTILRLPMVWGPGDGQRRLRPYIKRMDDGRPAILLGEQQAQWRTCRGYVENVAAAIAAAVLNPRAAGRVYNVADDAQILSERQWVEAIAGTLGYQGEIRILPDEKLGGGKMEYHIALDATRIRTELGWREEVSLAEGIARTAEWERANPPAQEAPDAFDYAKEDSLLAE